MHTRRLQGDTLACRESAPAPFGRPARVPPLTAYRCRGRRRRPAWPYMIVLWAFSAGLCPPARWILSDAPYAVQPSIVTGMRKHGRRVSGTIPPFESPFVYHAGRRTHKKGDEPPPPRGRGAFLPAAGTRSDAGPVRECEYGDENRTPPEWVGALRARVRGKFAGGSRKPLLFAYSACVHSFYCLVNII